MLTSLHANQQIAEEGKQMYRKERAVQRRSGIPVSLHLESTVNCRLGHHSPSVQASTPFLTVIEQLDYSDRDTLRNQLQHSSSRSRALSNQRNVSNYSSLYSGTGRELIVGGSFTDSRGQLQPTSGGGLAALVLTQQSSSSYSQKQQLPYNFQRHGEQTLFPDQFHQTHAGNESHPGEMSNKSKISSFESTNQRSNSRHSMALKHLHKTSSFKQKRLAQIQQNLKVQHRKASNVVSQNSESSDNDDSNKFIQLAKKANYSNKPAITLNNQEPLYFNMQENDDLEAEILDLQQQQQALPVFSGMITNVRPSASQFSPARERERISLNTLQNNRFSLTNSVNNGGSTAPHEFGDQTSKTSLNGGVGVGTGSQEKRVGVFRSSTRAGVQVTIEEEDIDTPLQRVTKLVKNIFGSNTSGVASSNLQHQDSSKSRAYNQQPLEVQSIKMQQTSSKRSSQPAQSLAQSHKQTKNEDFIVKSLVKTLGGQIDFALQSFAKVPFFGAHLLFSQDNDKLIQLVNSNYIQIQIKESWLIFTVLMTMMLILNYNFMNNKAIARLRAYRRETTLHSYFPEYFLQKYVNFVQRQFSLSLRCIKYVSNYNGSIDISNRKDKNVILQDRHHFHIKGNAVLNLNSSSMQPPKQVLQQQNSRFSNQAAPLAQIQVLPLQEPQNDFESKQYTIENESQKPKSPDAQVHVLLQATSQQTNSSSAWGKNKVWGHQAAGSGGTNNQLSHFKAQHQQSSSHPRFSGYSFGRRMLTKNASSMSGHSIESQPMSVIESTSNALGGGYPYPEQHSNYNYPLNKSSSLNIQPKHQVFQRKAEQFQRAGTLYQQVAFDQPEHKQIQVGHLSLYSKDLLSSTPKNNELEQQSSQRQKPQEGKTIQISYADSEFSSSLNVPVIYSQSESRRGSTALEEHPLTLSLDPSNFLKPKTYVSQSQDLLHRNMSTGKSSQMLVSFGHDTSNHKNDSNTKLHLNLPLSQANLSKPNSSFNIDMTLGVAKQLSTEKNQLQKGPRTEKTLGDFELLSQTVISKFHTNLGREDRVESGQDFYASQGDSQFNFGQRLTQSQDAVLGVNPSAQYRKQFTTSPRRCLQDRISEQMLEEDPSHESNQNQSIMNDTPEARVAASPSRIALRERKLNGVTYPSMITITPPSDKVPKNSGFKPVQLKDLQKIMTHDNGQALSQQAQSPPQQQQEFNYLKPLLMMSMHKGGAQGRPPQQSSKPATPIVMRPPFLGKYPMLKQSSLQNINRNKNALQVFNQELLHPRFTKQLTHRRNSIQNVESQEMKLPLDSGRSSYVSSSPTNVTSNSVLFENAKFGGNQFQNFQSSQTAITFSHLAEPLLGAHMHPSVHDLKIGKSHSVFGTQRMQKLNEAGGTANQQRTPKLSTSEIKEIEKALDYMGMCQIALLFCMLWSVKTIYLKQLFLFQYGLVYIIHMKANQILHSFLYKQATYVIAFCIMQHHPFDHSVSLLERMVHVVATLIMIGEVMILQKDQSVKNDQMTKRMTQIIQSDSHLKNLVQLIPYGIAVLNLSDVTHFNYPFGKVFGVKKQKQVIAALMKFKRKVQNESSMSVSQAKQEYQGGMTRTAKQVKKQRHLADQKSVEKYCNLRDDLEFLLTNKEQAFTETHNIFEIYFVEKEDQSLQPLRKNGSYKDSPLSANRSLCGDSANNSTLKAGRKYYSISVSPIDWNSKQCLLLTVKDVTHEKIIDQKKLIDRLRNMIFKSFSHELKTPLNGIIMSLETSYFIQKRVQTFLQTIRTQQGQEMASMGKQMQTSLKNLRSCSYVLKNIMHDFFDYNQLQQNELSLNVEEFNLNDCINDVHKIVKYQIQSRDIKFETKVETEQYQNLGGFIQQQTSSNQQQTSALPSAASSNPLGSQSQASIQNMLASQQSMQASRVRMVCDKDRLQQILLNLLMNAIKFTSQGTIDLHVSVRLSKNPPTVAFRVKDTGIGIEKSRHPNIFNLFESNEKSNLAEFLTYQMKSARMGLPISQNLCMLMGGKIHLESEVGKGSVFSFEVPLRPHEYELQRGRTISENHTRELSDHSSVTRRTIDMQAASPSDNHRLLSHHEESKSNLMHFKLTDQNEMSVNQEGTEKEDFYNSLKISQKSQSSKVDLKRQSSKDIYIEHKRRLGGFEIYFKSPNTRDHGSFRFFDYRQNCDDQDGPEQMGGNEDALTPKLMHSNTNIEPVSKQDPKGHAKGSFSPSKFRKMKTQNVHKQSGFDASGFQDAEIFQVPKASRQKQSSLNVRSKLSSNLEEEKMVERKESILSLLKSSCLQPNDSRKTEHLLAPDDLSQINFMQQNSNFSFQNYINSKKQLSSPQKVSTQARSSYSQQQFKIFQTPNLAPNDDILDDFEREKSSSDSNSSVSQNSTKGQAGELSRSIAAARSKQFQTRGSHGQRAPQLFNEGVLEQYKAMKQRAPDASDLNMSRSTLHRISHQHEEIKSFLMDNQSEYYGVSGKRLSRPALSQNKRESVTVPKQWEERKSVQSSAYFNDPNLLFINQYLMHQSSENNKSSPSNLTVKEPDSSHIKIKKRSLSINTRMDIQQILENAQDQKSLSATKPGVTSPPMLQAQSKEEVFEFQDDLLIDSGRQALANYDPSSRIMGPNAGRLLFEETYKGGTLQQELGLQFLNISNQQLRAHIHGSQTTQPLTSQKHSILSNKDLQLSQEGSNQYYEDNSSQLNQQLERRLEQLLERREQRDSHFMDPANQDQTKLRRDQNEKERKQPQHRSSQPLQLFHIQSSLQQLSFQAPNFTEDDLDSPMMTLLSSRDKMDGEDSKPLQSNRRAKNQNLLDLQMKIQNNDPLRIQNINNNFGQNSPAGSPCGGLVQPDSSSSNIFHNKLPGNRNRDKGSSSNASIQTHNFGQLGQELFGSQNQSTSNLKSGQQIQDVISGGQLQSAHNVQSKPTPMVAAAIHKNSWQHFEVEQQIRSLLNIREELHSQEELKVEDSKQNSCQNFEEEKQLPPDRIQSQSQQEATRSQWKRKPKPNQQFTFNNSHVQGSLNRSQKDNAQEGSNALEHTMQERTGLKTQSQRFESSQLPRINTSLANQEPSQNQPPNQQQQQNADQDIYNSPPAMRNSNSHPSAHNNISTLQNLNIDLEDSQQPYFQSPHGQSQPPHQCPSIVVVDDVQMNRFAIEQMLQLIFGIKVLQAENGQQCIDKLKEFHLGEKTCQCEGGIRLIIMDLEMPVMNGIRATIKLKRMMAAGELPEIPIVALTAYLDEKDNCLRAGMKDFMTKPTSKAQLKQILRKFRIPCQE